MSPTASSSARRATAPRALVACLLLVAAACGGDETRTDEAARRAAAGFGDGYGGDAAAGGREAPLDVPADAPLLAVVGDSLAAGLHLPASRAWPVRLQRLLAEAGLPVRLQNAGVSGDTSAGGLARLDWILSTGPDVVIVELGGNDGLRGQPVASIERNLRAMLEKIVAAGARPLLVAMRMPPNYGPAYTADFSALYPRLADALDVPLVGDFLEDVGGVPSMNLPDGIHPTVEGHERLAANAFDEVAEVVRAVWAERAGPPAR